METVIGTVVMVMPGPSGLTIALQTAAGPRVGVAVGPLVGQLSGTMRHGETWALVLGENGIVRQASYGGQAPSPH
jgi:hypothetical protein